MSNRFPRGNILLVDDEESILDLFGRFFQEEGFHIQREQNPESALSFLDENHVDLITVDIIMPYMNGIEFIHAVREMNCNAEIIVISGNGSLGTAVEAIKLGAFDYIEKPVRLEKLRVIVENALQKGHLQERVSFLENRMKVQCGFSGIVGSGESITKAKQTAEQISGSDINVLITGETGTGKEVFAKAIHNSSERGEGPFVAINCGAISDNLLESELFGHEKGAFTGAVSRRIGHFEHADGGTLFLDEITEMPLPLQVKLLRVLQEKEFLRVGSTKPIKTDCRILSATNKNIIKEVEKGNFREDLYYRLNVIELKIPPLRDRIEDIPLLTSHLIKRHSKKDVRIDKHVARVFQNYSWPGNVRELENIIQRALALACEPVITLELLPPALLEENNRKSVLEVVDTHDLREAQEHVLELFNKDFIQKAFNRNQGNITIAAEQMGISRQSLHRMMKKYGISARDYKAEEQQ